MLSRLDSEGSGSVSKAEFDAGREAMRTRRSEHRNKAQSDN